MPIPQRFGPPLLLQMSADVSTGSASDQEKSSIPQMKQVYGSLQKHDKINLFGPQGVGKTRMAKKVSDHAVREKVFDFQLWVFMCREYTLDSLSLSIARQLFLIHANEEWEVEDDKNAQNEWEAEENKNEQERGHDTVPNTEKVLIKNIREKLNIYEKKEKLNIDEEKEKLNIDEEKETLNTDEKKENLSEEKEKLNIDEKKEKLSEEKEKLIDEKKKNHDEKKVLVILDDVLDGETQSLNETNFWKLWEQIIPKHHLNITTVLISRSRRKDQDYSDENTFEVKPLAREASIDLLKEKLDTRLPEKIHTLGKKFIEKFGDLPGTVVMIAKVLNDFCLDASGVSMLERELKEASEDYRLSKLLCIKNDVLPMGVLKDLRRRGDHFFRKSGSVHYSGLITYWILEGYLGGGSMKKLYKKGHGVLMELIDCGVLKMQEGGYVFMDSSLIDARDLYYENHVDQNPSLGLATALTPETDQGFQRITYNDGMLKTIPKIRKKKEEASSDEHDENLSTLLLDGTYVTERVVTGFIEREQKLKVFGLFYPTITSLPKALETMLGLRVLVLRGCEFLLEAKLSLSFLEFLEISDAPHLKRLNSGFFKNLLNLKSLHLSGLQIKSLPQAIYNLLHIQWLIVKDCPNLKKIESISKLGKLLVVDLSGNISLETLDKNFLKFPDLQSLNLSKTRLSTTPLLKNRTELSHLLCRECPDLFRLRGLSSLSRLETIDISGSKDFVEFHDSYLESLTSLITLNLSQTGIDHLPSNISKPRYLYLRSCLRLRRLSRVVSFTNLDVLDLSGSTELREIDNKFFDEMNCVRVLNLSQTKVSHLPSLSSLSNLRELFLSHCDSLEALPSLESATKLEILDASNCSALHEIESKTFESMTCLQKIDFSETKIESFPALPSPCTLRRLLLKNCTALQNLEELNVKFLNLEELNLSGIKSLKPNGAELVKDISSLRILDLSYTSIKQLPSISKLKNLTHLSLAGCVFSSELELGDAEIEVLDLSHSSIESLPKFNYTNLQKLLLKDCPFKEKPADDFISRFLRLEYIEFPDVECTPEDPWIICEVSHLAKSPVFHTASQFLNKNPKLNERSYHLSAVPVKVEGETWDTYFQRHELVFRDVYLPTCRLAQYKENKTLQLRGCKQFPIKDMEKIIHDIDLVFLIDYKLDGFPSGFDPSMFKSLKGCWIERCNKMVTIFAAKEGNDQSPGFVNLPFKDLAICNNIQLKSIYDGKQQQIGIFDNLTSLYIDSCPELTTVFSSSSSSWLPKNLQVVEIKYCDKISELGGELPETLQTLKIWECPNVKQLEGEFEVPKGLKTLWISGATSLKNLTIKNNDSINLETLKVENCPMLEYLMSSSSSLTCIRIIEIKSCEKMQTLCKDINNQQSTWRHLEKLHVESLPMLKQIGAHYPPVDDQIYDDCPNFQPNNID